MVYEIISTLTGSYNPLYTLNNQGFLHCSYPPTPASHRGSAPEESAKAHGTRWHTGWCHPAWFFSIGNGNFWALSISQMGSFATSLQSWTLKGSFCNIGRCGISLVFRASVRNVRDSGRCAGKACWARILLLFGCFGTSQWTLKAGFCNG